MNARDALKLALNHKEPDRVPFELGNSASGGMHVSTVARLRDYYGLEKRPVKIWDPYGMLGWIDEDLRQALGADVVTIGPKGTMFGFRSENWKPWTMPDGTEALIGGGCEMTTAADGSIYMYPGGDTSVPPCAKMPKGGFYFDNIVRQDLLDENDLDVRRDWAEDFALLTDEELRDIETAAKEYYENTEYGICGGHFLGRIGDMAMLGGGWIKKPRGVRDIETWLIFHHTHPEYVKETYDYQMEFILKNLEMYWQAVGDRAECIQISGSDFGSQRGMYFSFDMYREFYKPYHIRINEWVHKNTTWKTFYHSCGSVVDLLDDFIESGWDIFNTVQCSAAGMDPAVLKEKCKGKLVLWGGMAETQSTLQFGTPEEVYNEVAERLKIFAPGGGYIANPQHDIQPKTPCENIDAMAKALRDYNKALINR